MIYMKKVIASLMLFVFSSGLFSQERGEVISYEKILNHKDGLIYNLISRIKHSDIKEWILSKPLSLVGYKVVYYTVNENEELIKATGLIMYPDTPEEKSLLLYNHGTTNHKNNVPSNLKDTLGTLGFALPLLFASNNHILVAPDNQGHGDGEGNIMYMDYQTTVNSTMDMMKASQTIIAELGIAYNQQNFINGYSQGAHSAMSVLYHQSVNEEVYSFDYAYMGAGPYDLSESLYEAISVATIYPFSAIILNLINTCKIKGYSFNNTPEATILEEINEMLKPKYAKLFEERIINQKGDNLLWGNPFWKFMFYPEKIKTLLDDPENGLVRCLRESNVYDFKNDTPSTLGYSKNDLTVPEVATHKTYKVQRAKFLPSQTWERTKIKKAYYGPFGHVGGIVGYLIGAIYTINKYKIEDDKPAARTSKKVVSREILALESDEVLVPISERSVEELSAGQYLIKESYSDGTKDIFPHVAKETIAVDATHILTKKEAIYTLSLKGLEEQREAVLVKNTQGQILATISINQIQQERIDLPVKVLSKGGDYVIEVQTTISNYEITFNTKNVLDDSILIEEETKPELIAYRDSNNQLKIQSVTIKRVKVYSMNGQEIAFYTLENGQADLMELPKGIYVLQYQNKNRVKTLKIIR